MAKDKDGNSYNVSVVIDHRDQFKVGIHAEGVWLSASRAKAFAGRVVAAALRAERLQRKRRLNRQV